MTLWSLRSCLISTVQCNTVPTYLFHGLLRICDLGEQAFRSERGGVDLTATAKQVSRKPEPPPGGGHLNGSPVGYVVLS